MKKMLFILTAIIIFLGAVSAWALDFSADMTSTADGARINGGKIFVADKKVRIEMPGGTVSIARMDKGVAWIIMPDQKIFMEQPIDPQTLSGALEKMPGETERTSLGPDTIDGRPVIKYRVVYKLPNGQHSMLQWIDNASAVPLKTSSEDGAWSTEYKNLIVGRQEASLFELPEGYSKFDMTNIKAMAKSFVSKK